MALNTKTSYILPEILVDAIESAINTVANTPGTTAGGAGMPVMLRTGAAVMNVKAKFGVGDVGNTVDIPYFTALGDFETPTNDGDPLTVADHTSTREQATVRRSGKAFSMTDWAQTGASDPYADASRQLVGGFLREIDKWLLTSAISVDAAMTLTVGADTATASARVGLDYDVFVDWRQKFLDEQDEIAAMVVRSEVLHAMWKLKGAVYGSPSATDAADGATSGSFNTPLLVQANQNMMPTFHGIPVFVSDRLPLVSSTNAPYYRSLLLKKNSLSAWINGSPTVETDRDILTSSDIAAVTFYHAEHKYLHMPGMRTAGVAILQHNLLTGA